MKNRFAEYYELPEERIKEIWENSLIVFDTNVLLNLYRYNEDARTEFINVIKFYKERLWIPYQVGLEFHRRREDIMRKNAMAYTALGEKLTEQLVKTVSTLEGEYSRHPYINMKDIRSKVERCAASIKKSLDKQKENHPDYSKEDKILNAITDLFDGRVGEDFAENDLDALYKEGEKRYANDVPPGYCDEKTKKDKPKRHLYGDLIVWKQTINHCKERSKNVIFITDDHKPDWWDKVDGKHTPRKELIKEFADRTGQSIIIYDSRKFLEYAKRNKELKVSQKTINEVEKVKRADTFWITEEMLPTILSARKSHREHLNLYNKYSTLIDEAKTSLTDPLSYLRDEYDYFSEFRKRYEEPNIIAAAPKSLSSIGTIGNLWGDIQPSEPITISSIIDPKKYSK
ncbi:MAG: DUF4935 domain-containing protein [Alistipes sp.]|nr:DUF4935 domain-containing protein [Alistipes sp.]